MRNVIHISSLASSNRNRRREGVETVSEQRVIRRYKAPLVLSNVVDLARHVIVSTNDVDLPLEEEALV